MKFTILKAVVACTLALSLLFMGIATVSDVNTYATARHDGPLHEDYVY